MSFVNLVKYIQGFYCDAAAAGNGFPGCAIECADDEILIVDPRNGGNWECTKLSDISSVEFCPGKFHTGVHLHIKFDQPKCTRYMCYVAC